MNFAQWVNAVLDIARGRGLVCVVTYPRPGWATFNWRCQNGSGYGSCGAGEEFIYLTTPEAFTWLWHCGPIPEPPPPVGLPWNRHGRFVPRVPAMATSDALNALFLGSSARGAFSGSANPYYGVPAPGEIVGPISVGEFAQAGKGQGGGGKPGNAGEKGKGKNA